MAIEHKVPDKSDLMKLRLKHLVVGNETKALAKALDEFHKVASAKTSTFIDIAAPLSKLCTAIKEFKADYKTSHPKFIKSLEKDVEEPVQELLETCQELVKTPQIIADYRKTVLERVKQLHDLIENGLTPTHADLYSKLIDKIAYGMLPMKQHAEKLQDAGDTSSLWSDVVKEADTSMEAANKIGAVFQKLKKINDYNLSPVGLTTTLDKIVKSLSSLAIT